MANKLEIPYIHLAKKPFKSGFLKAQKTLNENQEEKIRIEIKKYKKTINFNYK